MLNANRLILGLAFLVTAGDAHEAEEQGVRVHRVVVAIVLMNVLKEETSA